MADTNELFDKVKSDFQAAIDREVQIRTNYESGLIPSLERDLQASRASETSLLAENKSLLKWKGQAENALAIADRALTLLHEAIEAAPGTAPLE